MIWIGAPANQSLHTTMTHHVQVEWRACEPISVLSILEMAAFSDLFIADIRDAALQY